MYLHLHLPNAAKIKVIHDGIDLSAEYDHLLQSLLDFLKLHSSNQKDAKTQDDEKSDSDVEHWVTIHGTHVKINGVGEIVIGPKEFIGKKPDEIGGKKSEQPQGKPEGTPGQPGQPLAPSSLGTKPTKASTSVAKHAIHELLSSGHPFTIKELAQATGHSNEKTIAAWLSMFKNPKTAGSKGVLHVEKLPSGEYQIMQGAAPAPAMPKLKVEQPTPAAELTIKSFKPEAPKAEPAAIPAPVAPLAPAPATSAPPEAGAHGITVPTAPMSLAEADKHYKQAVNAEQDKLTKAIAEGGDVEKAVIDFKNAKTLAQLQWQTNKTGNAPHSPPLKHTQSFQADKKLVSDLKAINANHDLDPDELDAAIEKAFAEHKKNTALEKSGQFGVAAKAKQANAELKPSAAAPELAEKLKKAWEEPHTSHTFSAPSQEQIVPAGHKHISMAEDFAGGAKGHFTTQMEGLRSKLVALGHDDVSNKIGVQKILTEALTQSPAFQNIKLQYQQGKISGEKSLERTLISSWASSSGGHNHVSVAMQLSTRDAFGMSNKHLDMRSFKALEGSGPAHEESCYKVAALNLGVKVDTPAQMEQFKAGLRDFSLAQYHATQDHFKKIGVSEICMTRGMKFGSGSAAAKEIDLTLQPASSFSVNHTTALGFAGGHSLFMVKVPVSQVLSCYQTGFGCTGEHELTVLAHKNLQAIQVGSGHAMTSGAAAMHIENVNKINQIGATAPPTTTTATIQSPGQPAKPLKVGKVPKGIKMPPTGGKNGFTKSAYEAAKLGDLKTLQSKLDDLEEFKKTQSKQMPNSTAYIKNLISLFGVAV